MEAMNIDNLTLRAILLCSHQSNLCSPIILQCMFFCFTICRLTRRSVYYQQEDGTKSLASVFALYREDDITFNDGGAVIYELATKPLEHVSSAMKIWIQSFQRCWTN